MHPCSRTSTSAPGKACRQRPHAFAHAARHAFEPASGCRPLATAAIQSRLMATACRLLFKRVATGPAIPCSCSCLCKETCMLPCRKTGVWPCAKSKGCLQQGVLLPGSCLYECCLHRHQLLCCIKASIIPCSQPGAWPYPRSEMMFSAMTCMCCCSRASTSPWLFCNGLWASLSKTGICPVPRCA